MTIYNFQSYPATADVRFTCPNCGKKNRKRTFRHECTVNPFNVHEDGTPRTAQEVRAQSQARAQLEKEQFLREPLCKSCEDALSYSERRNLSRRRRAEADA